jgi:hypothetical protein
MRHLAKGFGLIAVPVMLAAIAGAPHRALAEEIPFETIEEGSSSSFNDINDCYQAGSQFVFKERGGWERFWEAHSSGSYPAPPLPEVKFAQETVVAVLRGCHSPSEGPRIKIFLVEQIDRETRVHVLKYNGFGSDLAIGNAFHIVKIPRVKGSISFVHDEVWENDRFCSTDVECHPAMICNFEDSFCQASYLEGICELPGACPPEVVGGRDLSVCGCDGVTYANDCMRINAGVVLKHRGKCL